MCGFLLYPMKVSPVIVGHHLEIQKHRGEDGYGTISLARSDTDQPHHTKDLKRAKFLKQYSNLKAGGMIVHHRKASVGGIKADLVHPVSDIDKQVYLFQNGTRRELATLFFEASDTKALAQYWNEVSDEALCCMLEGCGVVFAYDKGKLWFHRDDGRTLYKCTEGKFAGMYSSEPVAEGMWGLVDTYWLKELPLDMNQWDLEHAKPVEYKERACIAPMCKDTFVGTGSQFRCPDCESWSKYYYPSHSHAKGGKQRGGNRL